MHLCVVIKLLQNRELPACPKCREALKQGSLGARMNVLSPNALFESLRPIHKSNTGGTEVLFAE